MVEYALLEQLLPKVIDIAKSAGLATLPFYQKIQPHQIFKKGDKTPVTEADHAANAVIERELKTLLPEWPVLSEEGDLPVYSDRKHWSCYWLVDPLDGTRGFIRHSKEFTVNIALIHKGIPILGVIVQPVTGDCFFALEGGRAFHQQNDSAPMVIEPSTVPSNALRVLSGHFDRIAPVIKEIFTERNIELIKMNSSIKFTALARGVADIYCRFGPTSEWDTAAGQCILRAAGGEVVDFDGNPLQYNAKISLINPHFLAVRDKKQIHPYLEIIQKLRRKL